MVSLLSPNSLEAEQFKRLRHMVEQMRDNIGMSVVAVTSPAAGDGKSLIATNLAGALAQSPEAKVLLVEADLRKPSLHLLLGLGTRRRCGLVDAVCDTQIALSDVVLTRGESNLAVMLAGSQTENPYEILKSERFQSLLNDARHHYDFVVVDTPPLLFSPDCQLLENRVDGFLIVVRANKTPRKLVDVALGEIAPDKVLGIVFNHYQHLSKYYSSYYASSRSGVAKPREMG